MSRIYLYDGPFEKGEAGYPLVQLAGERYAQEMGLNYDFSSAQICREEKGKPYFVDIPLEFSLSHSGQMWMCIVSDSPCGLDLQQIRACSFEAVASRQYSEEEQHYTALWGIEGFFDIWVRKEAFVKCTGQGLFSHMPSVAGKDGDLCRTVRWKGKQYFFTDIDIGPELRCSVCSEKELSIEMRLL